MGDKTGIEWTDATWNPIVGCSIVSPACTNCYAMAQAARIEAMMIGRHAPHAPTREDIPQSHYAGTTEQSKAGPVWTGKMVQAPEHILIAPLRWKRPRKIFVNSMGDLFHENVPDEWIDRVFAVMALAPQHTFQILTKRAKRMREYMTQATAPGRQFGDLGQTAGVLGFSIEQYRAAVERLGKPFPNVWLGVTAEDQTRADERIPDLLATPAAKRFASCEPLLGPIDLGELPNLHSVAEGQRHIDALKGFAWECHGADYVDSCGIGVSLDWIIAGGESGAQARPSHPDWFRSLRDQCDAAGVPYFFKQWGEFAPSDGSDDPWWKRAQLGAIPIHVFPDLAQVSRVGKRRAGSLLDGREHKEFPA